MHSDQFVSPDPRPIDAAMIDEAASDLRVEPAALDALVEIEGGGATFWRCGRPPILFEAHVFARLTERRYTDSHPHLSALRWDRTLYGPSGGHQYSRLDLAMDLDPIPALKSASWGAFQLMGFNHEVAGHADVERLIEAVVSGPEGQLESFLHFVGAIGAVDDLRGRDWAGFARKYNGPGFRQNRYDQKLAAAYGRHRARREAAPDTWPVLRRGRQGPTVRRLQRLLGDWWPMRPAVRIDYGDPLTIADAAPVPDGVFGRRTDYAVRRFQADEDLTVDGIVGRQTWSALLDLLQPHRLGVLGNLVVHPK